MELEPVPISMRFAFAFANLSFLFACRAIENPPQEQALRSLVRGKTLA
jgi:hypothetical protein